MTLIDESCYNIIDSPILQKIFMSQNVHHAHVHEIIKKAWVKLAM